MGRGRPARLGALAWALAAAMTAGAAPAGDPAGDAKAPGREGSAGEAGRPSLDQLLELPKGLDYGGQRRGGLTRGEWRSRFQGLRKALDAEQRALDAAKKELGEIAGSSDAWSVGPPIPGAGSSDTPLDYRLRQEINRHKDEVDRLERALRELAVQADLAGVPEEWRE
jgi:hypothetical protein